jgi:hypothetical protein
MRGVSVVRRLPVLWAGRTDVGSESGIEFGKSNYGKDVRRGQEVLHTIPVERLFADSDSCGQSAHLGRGKKDGAARLRLWW